MMNMNMNIGMNNTNLNQGMLNMNQIYMQLSQLMAQAMININQIMTNMNQLMTNMNKMNELINSVNGVQQNNELNINLMTDKKNNFYELKGMMINIVFEQRELKINGVIQYNSKEKLKDVIQRYRIKYGDTKSDTFIYNSKILNLDDTIEEIRISNGGRIVCLDSTYIRGGNEIQ